MKELTELGKLLVLIPAHKNHFGNEQTDELVRRGYAEYLKLGTTHSIWRYNKQFLKAFHFKV